jgi:hypothetical protein
MPWSADRLYLVQTFVQVEHLLAPEETEADDPTELSACGGPGLGIEINREALTRFDTGD